jgi:hypothetical protein
VHVDVCVVGEINPDLILYGLPKDLQPERESMIQGFRLTLGSPPRFSRTIYPRSARVWALSRRSARTRWARWHWAGFPGPMICVRFCLTWISLFPNEREAKRIARTDDDGCDCRLTEPAGTVVVKLGFQGALA